MLRQTVVYGVTFLSLLILLNVLGAIHVPCGVVLHQRMHSTLITLKLELFPQTGGLNLLNLKYALQTTATVAGSALAVASMVPCLEGNQKIAGRELMTKLQEVLI